MATIEENLNALVTARQNIIAAINKNISKNCTTGSSCPSTTKLSAIPQWIGMSINTSSAFYYADRNKPSVQETIAYDATVFVCCTRGGMTTTATYTDGTNTLETGARYATVSSVYNIKAGTKITLSASGGSDWWGCVSAFVMRKVVKLDKDA